MSTSTLCRRTLAQATQTSPLRCLRALQTTAAVAATPLPITAAGPPPLPPEPLPSLLTAYRRRHRQAEALNDGRSRFWKQVFLTSTTSPSGRPELAVTLDDRVIRTPAKHPLTVPFTKPLLAAALVLEWSVLRMARDAIKPHLIPLTQLVSRALDLSEQQRVEAKEGLLGYLQTDTALCLAPSSQGTLRKMQKAEAEPVVEFLRTRLGIEVGFEDGDNGIAARGQTQETMDRARRWLDGLGDFELVGFERVVQGTKSFVLGMRLMEEWRSSEDGGGRKWGVEEAALAATVEVRYQIEEWGEVEDSHDVDKESMRRQIGAGWLLMYNEAESE